MKFILALPRWVGLAVLAVASAQANAGAIDWTAFSRGGKGGVGTYFGNGANAVSSDAVAVDPSGSVYVVTTKASGGNAIITTKYAADGQRDWQRLYPVVGKGHLIALGADGNVVVAGVNAEAGPSDQFQLVKYDGQSGQLLWERRIPGTTANAEPASVKIDDNGDVLLAGQQTAGSELMLFKVDGNVGSVTWSRTYDLPDSSNDRVVDMQLTASGDVILVGNPQIVLRYAGLDGQIMWTRQWPELVTPVSSQMDSTGNLYLIGDDALNARLWAAKIAADNGQFIWQAQVDPGSGREHVRESAIDSQGNLLLVGTFEGGTAFVTKFAGASGQTLWTQQPNLSHFAYGVIAVDALDRPYVAFGQDESLVLQRLAPESGLVNWQVVETGFGQLFGGLAIRPYGTDAMLLGYNPANTQAGDPLKLVLKAVEAVGGSLRWSAADAEVDELDESASCTPEGNGNRAVLDSAGNTFVIGCAQAHSRQITVSRFASDGRLDWRSILPLVPVAGDACCIRLLGPDSLLIGGGANLAIAAFRISRQTGAVEWARTYEFPAANGQSESMIDMEVDTAGNAVLTGGAHLAKISASDGAPIWTMGTWGEPYIADVALDAEGDVYTIGSTATVASGRDLLVSKRSGQDGQLLWAKDFDGSGRDEIAVAIVVDDLPRVYALAMSMNNSFRNDFLTLQLNAQTGAELWTKRQYFDGNRARADAMAVDGNGGVIVSGVRFSSPSRITTVGYSPTGAVNFTSQIVSGYTESDWVRDLVAVDGNVHLVGALQRQGRSNTDFFHASISSVTGMGPDPLAVDFGRNGADWATDVLPLPSGKLRVVGQAHTRTGKRMVATEIDPDGLHRGGFETAY